MQGKGEARAGKGKKGGKRREETRGRKEKGREGGEEREREGDTRHTKPSLLPAPLNVRMHACMCYYVADLLTSVSIVSWLLMSRVIIIR